MSTTLDFVKRQSAKMSSSQQAIEWYKCKVNPFYFIFNYVYIPKLFLGHHVVTHVE